MKELHCQLDAKHTLHPASEKDLEELKSFHPNQIVRCKVYGTRKERSISQLGTYWACCKLVANNLENPQWNTKDKVDFQCRVAIHFVDPNLVAVKPDGTVVFHYRSIAFNHLQHIEACQYFDRAFEVMAKALGTTPEKLIEMAKENMQRF